jgi:hypothetical protein
MSLAWINTFLTNQFGIAGTRNVLLFGTFISEAAVAIGVILEAPKDKTCNDWAAIIIVVAGVCLGVIFTIDLFSFDEGISEAQQSTISDQNLKIIALEKQLAPRHLEQSIQLTNRMKDFSGTKFAISAAASAEAENFAIEIADALTAAGWRWINWPLGGIAINPPKGRPQIGMDLMAGIESHIFDEKNMSLATELFHALSDIGVESQWVLLPPNAGVADTIIIVVGSKK